MDPTHGGQEINNFRQIPAVLGGSNLSHEFVKETGDSDWHEHWNQYSHSQSQLVRLQEHNLVEKRKGEVTLITTAALQNISYHEIITSHLLQITKAATLRLPDPWHLLDCTQYVNRLVAFEGKMLLDPRRHEACVGRGIPPFSSAFWWCPWPNHKVLTPVPVM